MEKQFGKQKKETIMKKKYVFPVLLLAVISFSCKKDDYIIGGTKNETNKVDQTSFEFLKSFEATTQTATLIEKAGMINEVNGNVTIFAPSNYAIKPVSAKKE